MKLKLSIISISLVTMATARHNEVIMRPLDAPDHICGSGGCNTMSHLETPHPYSMCGEDLLGITSMDLSEDPISPGTTAKVTLKGLPIIDIGSGSITATVKVGSVPVSTRQLTLCDVVCCPSTVGRAGHMELCRPLRTASRLRETPRESTLICRCNTCSIAAMLDLATAATSSMFTSGLSRTVM